MMSQDYELMEEYRERLKEKYTVSELAEILEVDIDEFLDVFERLWIENNFLLEEVGMLESED